MPSLRRSFSSLSVRSSPYPSSLSPTAPSSARVRAAPFHPRRSSASATAERRVLADIEWWRVHDGQCDLAPQDQAHDDVHASPDEDVSPGGMVTLSAAGGSHGPSQTPLSMYNLALHTTLSIPPDALAALSIPLYSPTGSRLGQDSVESTPELSPTPLETSVASCPFGDHFPFPSSLSRGGRPVHPLFGLRSISAPGLSSRGPFEPDFADMGGDSFSLDQNLFQ